MTTWRKKIKEIAHEDKIIACTLTDEEMDIEFSNGFGCSEGKPFTAWSEKYVYFPVVYDGAEWVGRAPRNPCKQVTEHQGGE